MLYSTVLHSSVMTSRDGGEVQQGDDAAVTLRVSRTKDGWMDGWADEGRARRSGYPGKQPVGVNATATGAMNLARLSDHTTHGHREGRCKCRWR